MNDKITLHKDTNLFGVDLKAGEYVRKKEWVGLTDDDVYLLETLHAPPIHPDFVGGDDWGEFVRAIEAKLKEKNGG